MFHSAAGVRAIRWVALPLICISLFAAGAGSEYVIRTWSVHDGLPQNFITAILQTHDGYLWLGTYGGLARFDGVTFTTFSSGTTPGLLSDRILGLCEDLAGTLWIATEDAGLSEFTNGTFTTYSTRDGLPSNLVRAVLATRDGELWVATLNGLARRKGKRFDAVALPETLAGSDVLALGHGQDGRLLIGMNRGLAEWKDGRFLSFHPTHDLVLTAFEDRHLNVWLGGSDGVYLLDRNGGSQRIPAITGEVRAILEDRAGDLWIAARSGLFRRENGLWTQFDERDGLSGTFIKALSEDSEGNLWAGANANGLNRLRRRAVTMIGAGPGLAAGSVVPVLEDHSGAIWMGMPSAGLVRFLPSVSKGPLHSSEASFRVYTAKDGLPQSVIWSLWEDRNGDLWIGSRGLARLHNGRFELLGDVGSSLAEGLVQAIYEDSSGRLWIGRTSGLFEIRGGAVAHAYRRRDGLADDDVRVITEDRAGALWVGTAGGLSRFDKGAFTTYTTSNGLPHHFVSAIYTDREDTVWAGTYGGGLARLRNGRFTSFNVSNGLAENVVSRILEDCRGNLWLSGNRGIYRLNRRELNDYADGKSRTYQVLPFDEGDGMTTAQCNGGGSPAGWKSRDGRLWFPTQRGVAVIAPESVTGKSQAPVVYIEQTLLDRKIYHPAKELILRPGVSDLEIHYTGLSFSSPERVRFRYRLAGLDDDWVEAGTRRAAFYTHLPPGHFRFHVTAGSADGVWNPTGAAIDVIVIPPYWQTWWFRLIGISLAAGALVYLYRRRVQAMERTAAQRAAYARQLIESQETERQRIAADLHDSLGQTLAIIRNRALMSLNEPENQLRAIEQMEEIGDAASHALDEVREIAYNLRPYQIDRLGLRKSIEIMVARASRSSQIHFTTRIEETGNLIPPELRIHAYRIVQEAVNNVLKHSGATEASVTIRCALPWIEIQIADNGQGFARPGDGHGITGFGLNGMAERTRMLGGRFSFNGASGHGSVVDISIPAGGNEHV